MFIYIKNHHIPPYIWNELKLQNGSMHDTPYQIIENTVADQSREVKRRKLNIQHSSHLSFVKNEIRHPIPMKASISYYISTVAE